MSDHAINTLCITSMVVTFLVCLTYLMKRY